MVYCFGTFSLSEVLNCSLLKLSVRYWKFQINLPALIMCMLRRLIIFYVVASEAKNMCLLTLVSLIDESQKEDAEIHR